MSNLKTIKTKNIPIELDRTRYIRYDLNAFAEMEDRYGSVEKAMAAIEEGSIKAVRFILWAGLVHEDETLTERQVGAFVGLQEMSDIQDAILNALESANPAEDAVGN